MTNFFSSWFRVGLYAFVCWVSVLLILFFAAPLPRWMFISVRYLSIIFIFGYAFRFFYKTNPNRSAYLTTIFVLISLFVFEWIYANFFSSAHAQFFNYFDWIFPMFLTATTVYAAHPIFVYSRASRSHRMGSR